LLESTRGPAGGFRLAARHERTSLAEIVAVFETAEPRRCLLGHGLCGTNPQCTVHERWAPIATSMSDFFGRTTIADLLSTRTSS
jgi:Rrf2 family iron-sulfur cluster assembly transcriptional regulator